ncbi:MAG: diguanylate cyclase, partial [Campylobacteraceae bacterium]|nr:diguanylate cyclase [Campylobacteraceae bacterium]
ANIVMLTSKGDNSLIVEAIKYGAKGYILKPPNPQKIKDSIMAVFPKEFEEKNKTKKELDVQDYESTIKDTLTDFYTVEYMHNTIQHLIAVHNKDINYSICMILIDINNLDEVSEKFGSVQRDVVLTQITDVIEDLIDESNIPIKLCNNEFGIFIIGSLALELSVICNEIKKDIEAIVNKMAMSDTKLMVSIGVACHTQEEKLIHFLERADASLIRANKEPSRIFINS